MIAQQERVAGESTPAAGGEALDFLLGRPGVRAPHSGGTLIEHLLAVHDKLKAWGSREALCQAGLYHSVYGTDNFRQQTVSMSERPAVSAVIGEEAERLAYGFCMLNTRAFLAEIEADLEVSGGQLRDSDRFDAASKLDLLHIFMANWL